MADRHRSSPVYYEMYRNFKIIRILYIKYTIILKK